MTVEEGSLEADSLDAGRNEDDSLVDDRSTEVSLIDRTEDSLDDDGEVDSLGGRELDDDGPPSREDRDVPTLEDSLNDELSLDDRSVDDDRAGLSDDRTLLLTASFDRLFLVGGCSRVAFSSFLWFRLNK